ncbi:MAG: TRAP transporter substrate-binding protein DctP [Ardenticatenia bacterium]|nr:TRAP transporter substrate-binding protein DctP [Ardenticatenia bacterium]
MKRRDFLRLAAQGTAATVVTVGLVGCRQQVATPTAETGAPETPLEEREQELTEVIAQDTGLPEVEWQMATSWPLGLDTIFGGAQVLAERVAAMTGNKFRISPRAAGELAPGLQVLDAVIQGAVPIGHTASNYYIGKSPVMAFGTALPFGLTAQQQNAWLYEGGGLEWLQNFYAERFNVIQFPAGNTGVQMGGWFRKEIETTKDVRGLRMRISGLGGQVMGRLGAIVQVLPGGEIFQALQMGAIDAAEWVGPYDDRKLGLHRAATYYYYPGWWEPGTSLEVQINLDEWNKLPEEYQEVIRTAASQVNMTMLARYDARNGEALQQLLESGIEVRPFSDEILQAAEQASFDLFEEMATQDADFREIFDQWLAFRDRIYSWHSLNEASFSRYYSALRTTLAPLS